MSLDAERLIRFRPNVSNEAGVDRDVLALGLLVLTGACLSVSSTLVVSLALVAAAGILALWSPVGAGWAICCALPFVAQPVSIGDASFSLLEIDTLLAFASVVTHLLLTWAISSLYPERVGADALPRHSRRSEESLVRGEDDVGGDFRLRSNWRRPLVVLAFGGSALVMAGLLSLANMPLTTHQDEALRLFRWTIAEPLMIFVAISYAVIQRGARPVVVVIASTAAIVALIALGALVLDPDRFQGDGVSRALVPYLHPNNLALFLERACVLLAAAMLFRAIRPGVWSGLALGAISLGAMATFSRGLIPAVVAGLLVAAWLVGNRKLALALFGSLAASLVVFALIASDRFLGGSGDSFIGERRYVWDAGARIVADYPVSGIGLDQFLYHHAPRYIAPEAWSERYLSHPHNVILDSWLSLGLPGLVFLFGSVAMLIRELMRWRQSGDPIPAVPAAAAVALVTGLVHGLVDNAYFLPDLAAFTWILVALIIAPSPYASIQSSDEPCPTP